jgi:exodeoxyribonuclease III
MKIVSWNVNGLRAVYRSGYWEKFLRLKSDVICLQETKVEAEQLPVNVRNVYGYKSFFASSEVRKGYSGVAVYTKIEPQKVDAGMGIKTFDQEGRLLKLYFKDFVLVNVYFPNGGQGPERLKYKLDFYDAFLDHIEKLRKDGHSIIFCGDVNTAHEEIDLSQPSKSNDKTGFLPEERAWLDEVVQHGYIDTFRYFNPEQKGAYSYWDMRTHAREHNDGWRLDYCFLHNALLPRLKIASIHPTVYGSDHCPVSVELYDN